MDKMLALQSVESQRPALAKVAFGHPLNLLVLAVTGSLLLCGAFVFAAGSVLLDLLAIAVCLALPHTRRRLRVRARQKARQRLAAQMGAAEASEWDGLCALAHAVGPLPPATEHEVDSLLTLYVNIGAALCEASREASRAGALADRALGSLRTQLASVAELVRGECARVAATRCEHAAARWRSEVDDALERAREEHLLLASD
ncbi:MAG TPA: hypothetical protein VFF06_17045 [Polyangia bacterium]|nr:hypothetical protein [Polyangia bacterium]